MRRAGVLFYFAVLSNGKTRAQPPYRLYHRRVFRTLIWVPPSVSEGVTNKTNVLKVTPVMVTGVAPRGVTSKVLPQYYSCKLANIKSSLTNSLACRENFFPGHCANGMRKKRNLRETMLHNYS